MAFSTALISISGPNSTIVLGSKLIITVTPSIATNCRIIAATYALASSMLRTWNNELEKGLGNLHLYMQKQCSDLEKNMGSMASWIIKRVFYLNYALFTKC